jgi:hypothetical protein
MGKILSGLCRFNGKKTEVYLGLTHCGSIFAHLLTGRHTMMPNFYKHNKPCKKHSGPEGL